MGRTLDAWCENCADVRSHTILDPGSCKCSVCDHVQVLVVPLEEGAGAPR